MLPSVIFAVIDLWPPVTTNECLKCLGIRDATCVVHYGFPNSPKVFGSRLFCMAENFRNLSERVSTDKLLFPHKWLQKEMHSFTTCASKRCTAWNLCLNICDYCNIFSKVPSQDQPESRPHVIRSVLLISERNVCHIIGVLRYLMRTSALLPSELLSFAEGVHVVREEQKTNRPLCNYLKSFGVCRSAFHWYLIFRPSVHVDLLFVYNLLWPEKPFFSCMNCLV